MGRVPVRRILLLSLNLVFTLLTEFTGLSENPLVVYITGRYDLIRSRMMEGSINYHIARNDIVCKEELVDLYTVGQSYQFITAPRRSIRNLGYDRSTCMRVNSINSTVMGVYFDDFWGRGPRRTQIFLFSISAERCDVVNFVPAWYSDTCIASIGSGDESVCHDYIFAHFAQLAKNRTIQMSVESDLGKPGVPFLKCRGRPERPFKYITDLMVHQAYWAGSDYHVEVQSSHCMANPILQDSDSGEGLFKVAQLNQDADVVVAVNNSGWFMLIVTLAYGVVAMSMVVSGILSIFLQSRYIPYVPSATRFLNEWRIFKVLLPFMGIANISPQPKSGLVKFKGSAFMASDIWMNHWLYMMLSMLDAAVTIRTTYIIFLTGSWMLSMKTNTENFIFTCSAMTKITWIVCLVHSLVRLICKLLFHGLKKLNLIRARTRDRLEWFIDATAMLTTYKLYSFVVLVILLIMLKVRGSTTFMRRARPYKRGIYGGDPEIAGFWGSEIVCDMLVIVSLVLAWGIGSSAIRLLSEYRFATRNSVLRLLQRRFVLVGWDVYIALEVLKMDPFDPTLVDDDVVMTNCSLGAILQQLYASGPSGYVTLAGDHIFLKNKAAHQPPELVYPLKTALSMGLTDKKHTVPGIVAALATPSTDLTSKSVGQLEKDQCPITTTCVPVKPQKKGFFGRKFRIASEGYFGNLLIVDVDDPGRFFKCTVSGAVEFEAKDQLSLISSDDIPMLLSNKKKLQFR